MTTPPDQSLVLRPPIGDASAAGAWRQVEVAAPAPAGPRAGLAVPWPDANQLAHETIRERTTQDPTGQDGETAKLLLRHTTAD